MKVHGCFLSFPDPHHSPDRAAGQGRSARYFTQMMRRASIAAALETEQGIVTGMGLNRSFVQGLEAA